jgi:AsmA protein
MLQCGIGRLLTSIRSWAAVATFPGNYRLASTTPDIPSHGYTLARVHPKDRILMKVLKVLTWILSGLLVLMVIAGVGVWLFFDPNQLKPHIQQQVEARTGRALTLEGDIRLSLFPWVGVELGPASLENAPGFGKRPFAKVRKVDLKVQLMPLFSGKAVTDVVVLEGVQLWLFRKRSGQANWDDLVGLREGAPVSEQVPAASGQREPSPTTAGPGLTGLSVGGVRISKAALIWDDRQAGRKVVVRDLNVRTGAIAANLPVALESRFKLEAGDPKVSGKVSLKGTLDVDPEGQRYSISEGELDLDLAGDSLPGGVFKAGLAMDGSVDLGRQVAEIGRLAGTILGVDFKATFKGTQIMESPSFKGNLKTAEFDPGKLIEQVTGEAPVTADPKALVRASLDMDLIAGASSVGLNRVVAVLDDTQLSGTASLTNYAAPAIKFNFSVDKIDLDRYLPPPPSEANGVDNNRPAAKDRTTASGEATGSGRMPAANPDLAPLRTLNVSGTARIDALRVNNLDLTDALVKVNAAKGRIRLDPARATLYGGKVLAKLGLNVQQKQPRLAADIKVRGIRIEPLLDDLTGEAMLSGTGGFKANLRAVGLSASRIKRTLDGKLAFVFRDGAIKGINVAHVIRQARAALNGEPPPVQQGPNQTDFAELKGSAVSVKGLLTNRDLLLKAPLLRLQGEGRVHLPTDRIDYRANVAIVSTLEGAGGKEFEDLQGLEIPVLITGSLSDPSIRPDFEALARAEAQRQLDRHKDEIQEQAQERLQKELGDDMGKQLGGVLKGFLDKGN